MAEDETEITSGLIRDLLRDQHPDLAELPLREVEGGWGNQMWRLGDELAVRIQRMDTDPDHQLKERRWLPLLAPRLPLPIPVPVRLGAPSERLPKIWTVMTWVPGLPLDYGSITRGEHAADTLAAFLRALHVAAPPDAPVDDGPRRAPQGQHGRLRPVLRTPSTLTRPAPRRRRPGRLGRRRRRPPHGRVRRCGCTAICIPRTSSSRTGRWRALSTSVTCSSATRRSDLAAAWVLLPAGTAARFFAAYAEADEATVRRARGLAVSKSLFLMLMGQNGDRGVPGGKPRGVRRDGRRSIGP